MPKIAFLRFFLIGSAFLIPASSYGADYLTPTETYHRCYVRMVRGILNPNAALLKQVKEGKISAPAACIALFESAGFDSSGVMKNRTDKQAQQILKTFHTLHQEWFTTKVNNISRSANYLIRDIEEPALYFTLAAFFPVIEFKSVVTLEAGLQGVRDSASDLPDLKAQRYRSFASEMPYYNSTTLPLAYFINSLLPLTVEETAKGIVKPYRYSRTLTATQIPDVTEVGTLVGVKNARSIILPNFAGGLDLSSPTLHPDLKIALETLSPGYEINGHMGGGIIGSQTFLLNNFNLTANKFPNGYALINRRIPTKVFEDLMCHELPTLTAADVANEVIPTSPYTFQTSSTCMQCHSSMDEAALGLRNLYIFLTAANPDPLKQNLGFNAEGVQRLPTSTTSKLYSLTPSIGRLHYRELLTNNLVSYSFSSLSEMGQIIAQGDDVYTCAAKRYYQYFTGINVALNKKATTKRDRYHQNFVIGLGRKLKTTQSVKEVLRDIFSSPTFNSPSYNPREAQ